LSPDNYKIPPAATSSLKGMHLNPNNCSPSSSSFSDRNLHRAFNKSSRRCLDGKVKREDTQRGGGAHADIWRGKITGRPGLVAIKILREFTGIDKEKLRHVSTYTIYMHLTEQSIPLAIMA